MKRLALTLIATTLFTGLAVAQQSPAPMSGMGMMAPNASDSASTKGYKAAMMKMMDGMPMMKFTGDADVDFMAHMKPHHQVAVDMAKVVVANGKDPEVKRLAQEIIAAQEKEIAVIDAWLKAKGK